MGNEMTEILTERVGEIQLVPLAEIAKARNPKNRNIHPPEQITELVEQFKYQGIRHPIIISKRSGLIVAGDGRFQAAQKLKMPSFPVAYQDFDNEDQEYAFGVADNAIQSWSKLDLAGINEDLSALDGINFDLDRLAIRDFQVEPADFEPGTEEEQGQLDKTQILECPHCKEHFERTQAKVIA